MEISLSISCLGLVILAEASPTLACCGEAPEAKASGVGDALQEEVATYLVLKVPVFLSLELVRGGHFGVLGYWARFRTIEMAPAISSVHSVLKTHCKCGPVAAIELESRDKGMY
jgi:hypothetical protein